MPSGGRVKTSSKQRSEAVKIKTEYVNPPIPVRAFDWSAVDDDTYKPGCPIGWGYTERGAIEDLMDQMEDA